MSPVPPLFFCIPKNVVVSLNDPGKWRQWRRIKGQDPATPFSIGVIELQGDKSVHRRRWRYRSATDKEEMRPAELW